MNQKRIQLLSDEVIGKIAAGEVVERPASAIKELVENSLDAGASAVTVEIKDGGIASIRVTDNGSGIRQSDIRMAFERHATSKLTEAKELSSIATLGFRGEALASIAAVSRVTCTTRTRDDVSGIRVKNEGGKILSIEEAACPEGTTFLVKDLFFNTPVRLRFLKKPAAEAALVSDLMMRLILSRPDVSFRYISQGRTLYHSAGDGKLESAVFSIYGNEMLRTMRRVQGHQGGVLLDGYVGIGESGRSSRGNQSFFINGRYMQSALLSTAVETACRERVMIGKYPTCVLHLTMPYEAVDVNVHPNKLTVRFADEAAVSLAVETLVREAIADRDALQRPVQMQLTEDRTPVLRAEVVKDREAVPLDVVRSVPPKADAPAEPSPIPRGPVPVAVPPKAAPMPAAALREPQAAYTVPLAATPAAPAAPAPSVSSVPPKTPLPAAEMTRPVEAEQLMVPAVQDAPKPLRVIGVLFKTYILVEYEDQLLMIDQHAVHERLLFDRLSKAYDQHEAGQELLVPMIETVTRREQEVLAENSALLEAIGFTVEPFGDSEVSVRSVPMILGEAQTRGFLHEVLDQLMGDPRTFTMEKRRAAILQTACKHAVKGGETLTEDAIRDLIERMVRDRVTPTCPHGRPLVVAITHTELDKKFKRIQQ